MKKSILLIISLFLTVSVFAQDVSSALRQAQARFESGNEVGAIELVSKVLKKYPNNSSAKELLAKFNQIILNREIDADWNAAVRVNTFESYDMFRSKHPHSIYDETASDNMAKRLADRFTPSSTYSDRLKAESYAKKSMTKDYISNKWKSVMAKKSTTSSSNYSSSTGSTSRKNSYSSSGKSSYSSGSNSSFVRYSSQKKTGYWSKEKNIAFGLDYSFDTDCFLGDLKSNSLGVMMRLGSFGGYLNGIVGLKYYSWSANKNFNWSYNSSKNMIDLSSFTMPLIANLNYIPGDFIGLSFYIGAGYEFNIASKGPQNMKTSGSWILQTGFGGRHWDFRFYGRTFVSAPLEVMEDEICGFGFTIYL